MPSNLVNIREWVTLHKGARVRCRELRSRRKVEIKQGVILETYPRLFTMFIESQTVRFLSDIAIYSPTRWR
jgi:uncharacterized protein Veg